MALRLHNTLGRELQEFVPLNDKQVGLYCCGPTVYNYAHIGNLRTYVFEDVLRRTLEYLGYTVRHVMNVTDVGHLTDDGDEGEDKMIVGARERGMTVWQIAEHFADAFFSDLDELNIIRPSVICKATDHIDEMQQLIAKLDDAKYAVRRQAYDELMRLGRAALPALKESLKDPKLSAEARSRIEGAVKKWTGAAQTRRFESRAKRSRRPVARPTPSQIATLMPRETPIRTVMKPYTRTPNPRASRARRVLRCSSQCRAPE